MTVQPLRGPLPIHLQPNSKATSTAQSSPLSVAAGGTPAGSRSSSRSRPVKQQHDVSNPEPLSDKASLSLIRRVLYPPSSNNDQQISTRPIEDVLPPLTSSNDIDFQLYALIAIVIKEYVQTWYTKITPDHTFIEEVIQIIAHCSRAVEQRLRRLNVEDLVFDDVSSLIFDHVQR